MDDDNAPPSPPSLKSKIKNSLCFSCCFRRHQGHHHRQVPDSPSDDKPSLVWVKTKAPHDLKDEIKDKCLTVLGRIGNSGNASGGGGAWSHKRHSSTEFRYDPLSYSLNFEDGYDYDDDEYPLRNFSARLPPPSSSSPQTAVPLRGITAV